MRLKSIRYKRALKKQKASSEITKSCKNVASPCSSLSVLAGRKNPGIPTERG